MDNMVVSLVCVAVLLCAVLANKKMCYFNFIYNFIKYFRPQKQTRFEHCTYVQLTTKQTEQTNNNYLPIVFSTIGGVTS